MLQLFEKTTWWNDSTVSRENVDPRYADEFFIVKEEIDKLQNADFSLIIENAKKLLSTVALDLRVAGYFTLASTIVDGVNGMTEGFALCNFVLLNLESPAFPERESARISALSWLSNNRLVHFATEQLAEADKHTLKACYEAFHQLLKTIAACNFSEPVQLGSLQRVIDKAFLEEKSKEEAKVAKEEATQQQQAAKATAATQATSANDMIKHVASTLREKGEWMRAIGVARMYRWGQITKLPKHNGQLTTIVRPGSSSLSRLETVIATGEQRVILSVCEQMFFEGSYHLNFDLQMTIYQALEALQYHTASAVLVTCLKQFVDRMPQIVELQYVGNEPFASVATKSWIQSLLVETSTSLAKQDTGCDYFISLALAEAKSQELIELLKVVQAAPAHDIQQNLARRHAMAKLCLSNKRPDMAVAILDSIDGQLSSTTINQWDKKLNFQILSDLSQGIRQQLTTADVASKSELNGRLGVLCQRLTVLAPVGALSLFS